MDCRSRSRRILDGLRTRDTATPTAKPTIMAQEGGVVHTEILLPVQAPEEFSNRALLWNAVEKIEKAENAQLAREVEFPLPLELTREQNGQR